MKLTAIQTQTLRMFAEPEAFAHRCSHSNGKSSKRPNIDPKK